MDQNQASEITPSPLSDRDHDLRDLIDRNRLNGFAIVLFGVTQVVLAMVALGQSSWSGLTVSSWSIFVFGGGGWLLIGIGVSMFQGRMTFENSWGTESVRLRWLGTVTTLVISVGAATGAVWVLFV